MRLTRSLAFRIASQQALYLAVAWAVVAVFWAITGRGPSLTATLIYSFVLGNLTALSVEHVRIPFTWRLRILAYVALLLAVIPVAVTLSTLIVFVVVPPLDLPAAPRTSFLAFLLTAWKFPAVASVIFAGGYLAYAAMRDRLEHRNLELQQTLESNLAQHRMETDELRQAHEIQRGLLPRYIPQVPGFEIAGEWEPARLVGGDYYDVIQLSPQKLAICIADVSGKGVSAALLMANVQAAVRAFASEHAPPSQVCAQTNSVLCNNTAPEKFVTLFYGVLDATSRTLSYANAGHLSPVLVRSNGMQSRLEQNGALLGVLPKWQYSDAVVELRPGDCLVLFTDGITEAGALDGDEFGEERLMRCLEQCRSHQAGQLQSYLLEEVRQFCHSRMTDDATVVVITCDRCEAMAPMGTEAKKDLQEIVDVHSP